MNAQARCLVAGAVVVGSAGGWWLASGPASPAFVAAPAVARSDPLGTRIAAPDMTKATGATVVGEDRLDASAAYLALRDDVNPKPRLRLIEDWSRARAPGASLDLLTEAMVDPDETVRARAQDLFERGLAADARQANALLRTPSP